MKRKWVLALVLIIAFILAGAALAQAGDPRALFTDNTQSSGPTQAVTAMEQVLLDHINAASSSIDLAIYGFDRASIRDALLAARARGVTVRVTADDDAYQNASYAPHYAALKAAGIPIVIDARSSIMHNKFIIIDGQVVWTGSTNLTDTCFSYNHNNSLVFTSTLMVEVFNLEFEEMFTQRLFGTRKTDNTLHEIDYNGIPVEIYFSPSDRALAEVIAEVNTATESISFSVFYFTDSALRDALIARKQAGVEVRGVWDRLGASNAYSQDEALCQAGIPIKIEDFGGKMHNKYLVIDVQGAAPKVITGSMNWTNAGDRANDENTVILHNPATAQAFQADFQQLYDALGPWTLCPGMEMITIYLPVVRWD